MNPRPPTGYEELSPALAERVDTACDRLEKAWRAGQQPPLEDYLADVEAAAAPVLLRELILVDILYRQRAGVAVPPAEYQARFPALDRAWLAAALQPATVPAPPWLAPLPPEDEGQVRGAVAHAPAGPLPLSVPGYTLLGELGRGGMGVVYKARQVSLNRLVALKMILAGAHAGADHLARFRTEAEAAARLQHPHIVQIHEVGEHDDRPYFSLEYVNGGSLAQRLAGTPQPPRQAAQLVETLARAMHYAHQQGIVHRDLKPANILLQEESTKNTKEREEKERKAGGGTSAPAGDSSPASSFSCVSWIHCLPKITDFGLAKFVAQEGSGPTRSGELLGTPSYMAPEQAAGRLRDIGPLTDVYALGAILYELLTGRPPFKGASLVDTLEQVRGQEPVPPRRLQPKVPRDLETICLKCLEKDPRRRYTSAAALADDCAAFLKGVPIQARPVGWAERALKWARRRPAQAALVAVIAGAVLLLLAGGWLMTIREATYRAEVEESFEDAEAAVEQFLADVGEVDLADAPHMEPVREKLLLRALGFFQKFLDRRGADPRLRQKTGRALSRVGDIQEMLGKPDGAERAYDQAIAALEKLAADFPGVVGHRRELARAHHNRGVLLKKAGRAPEAEQALGRALLLREELAGQFPDEPNDRQDVAASRYELGALLAPLAGRQREADEAYRQALTIREGLVGTYPDRADYQREWARTLNNLGILQKETGREEEAEQSFGRARDILGPLAKQFPDVTAYRRDLARSCGNLGTLQEADGKEESAVASYSEARDLLERLARDFPTVPEYRHDLAGVLNNLGRLLQKRGRTADAEAAFREAVARSADLAAEVRSVPAYRQRLAAGYRNLAILLEQTGRPHEAEEVYRRALPVQEQLLADYPGRPEYESALGMSLHNLAALLFWRGELAEADQRAELVLPGAAGTPWPLLGLLARGRLALGEARSRLEPAIAHQRAALAANAVNPRYRDLLRSDYTLLALVLLRLGEHAESAAAAEELPHLFPETEAEYRTAARFIAHCVPRAAEDGRLPEAQRRAAAEAYARRAVELLREAVARGFKDVHELRTLPDYDPLRRRDDFKKLLQDLEDRARTGVG